MSDDPEIAAMQAIAAALRNLDVDAKGRVLRWAAERHGVAVKGTQKAAERGNEIPDSPDATFEHFGDLFDACNPSNDSERMLVAGYWFQVLQQMTELDSQTLTKELKHAGHGIDHAPHSVDGLMTSKPSLMVQLKKAGSTRQARKKFKLTTAGIKRVKEMIAASST